MRLGIVDVATGNVYTDTTQFVGGLTFRRDSRLLIEDPTGMGEDGFGHPTFPYVRYFEWTGDVLVLRKALDASDARLSALDSREHR